MTAENKERWMELCDQASKEQDPKRFFELVAEIERTLQGKQDRLVAEIVKSRGRYKRSKIA